MKRIPTILVELAVFASLGDTRNMRRIGRSSRFSSVPPRKITEMCLELHLFAGFPASIEAFITISPYLRRRKRNRRKPAVRKDQQETGLKLLHKVYAGNYEKLLQNMESLNSDLADWIITYGYGRVLSRRGLSLKERELIAVASLAALGWRRQLRSHVLGALNAGASIPEMHRMWDIISHTVPKALLSRSRSAFFSALQLDNRGEKA